MNLSTSEVPALTFQARDPPEPELEDAPAVLIAALESAERNASMLWACSVCAERTDCSVEEARLMLGKIWWASGVTLPDNRVWAWSGPMASAGAGWRTSGLAIFSLMWSPPCKRPARCVAVIAEP